MTELRREPVVGRWVIVNVEESAGPEAFEKEVHSLKQTATCQFCTGRENQTPGEIDAVRCGQSAPNTPGWSVRVVPNKFPALRIEGDLNKRGFGLFDMSNGVGAHEVVIETPDHFKNLADFSEEEILLVLQKYQSRFASLSGDKRFKYILIFRNFGESAGASIEHGHSQIIALPMIPKYVREELSGAQEYYNYRGRCIFCDIIHQEYQDKERIITENNGFLAFCPYVSRYPFECWIFPKKHDSRFGTIVQGEQRLLAGILKETLSRIKTALNNPSYNFFFHLVPVNDESRESYHWHIEIVPKLTGAAGFEWGTGFYYVPTDPRHAAKCLRETQSV